MQVDLFSNSAVLNSSIRLGKQIETRKFRLGYDLEGIGPVLQEYPSGIVQKYVEHMKEIAKAGRSYEYVGDSGCDSVWELECLGVGEYARKYAVVINFSNALDYVMNCVYGCDLCEIRQIEDYDAISESMLNYNFKNVSTEMGALFCNSPRMMEISIGMLQDIVDNSEAMDTTVDERISHFVFSMYAKILNQLSTIKDYVVADLQRQFPKKLIYRSKNYSSIILTSEERLPGELILHQVNAPNYSIPVRCYGRYEWAREGVTYEIVRNSKHR